MNRRRMRKYPLFTKAGQIKCMEAALASPKTPKQFLPSLQSRLEKLRGGGNDSETISSKKQGKKLNFRTALSRKNRFLF